MTEQYIGPTGPTGASGNGIKYSYVNSLGHLVFVYDNQLSNNVGNILGPTGATGPSGPEGSAGPTGVGVQLLYLDTCCNLIITMTDGTTINAGNYSVCSGSGSATGGTGATGANTPSGIHYGYIFPSGATWPIGTTPVPVNPVPMPGDFYADINTGCIYSFNGTSWLLCAQGCCDGPSACPVINPAGSVLFSGNESPTGSAWPTDIVPMPTGANPLVGNTYVNSYNGSMYMYKPDSLWHNFQAGSAIKFQSNKMTVNIVPSTNSQGYPTLLGNVLVCEPAFTKMDTTAGPLTVSLAQCHSELWPPPANSTVLVCNEPGVYDISIAFNDLEFAPSLPNQFTGDIVVYVLNELGQFTSQLCPRNTTTPVKLGYDYKLVTYTTTPSMNNILYATTSNSSAFFEVTRRF